ncbi:MAG: carboxynorspermidine decarboxylase [Spirochaetales bacterium]|nr:carboxynorspermidine decarboxylase [Spirochaetales bacterium]
MKDTEYYLQAESPAFILNQELLEQNLAIVDEIQRETGVELIFALKSYGLYKSFPIFQRYIKGMTASSLNEAELANEFFEGGQIHSYAPVYLPKEAARIFELSSHVTFNSVSQYLANKDKYPQLQGKSCGLRINPEYSEVETDLYNPCIKGSRLGIRCEDLKRLPEGIEGLHSHNLCECGAAATANTLQNIEKLFGEFLPQIKWLNLGGGHLFSSAGYDLKLLKDTLKSFKAKYPHLHIILEPGAAFVWQTGVLVAEVCDIIENSGVKIAMLDTSFAAHMPDCLEMPYRPNVFGAGYAGEKGYDYYLGGCSCLAGDYIKDYSFAQPLQPGEKIIFADMMHYTMVKTNMFNGINLPNIYILHKDKKLELLKSFSYADYKSRL